MRKPMLAATTAGPPAAPSATSKQRRLQLQLCLCGVLLVPVVVVK